MKPEMKRAIKEGAGFGVVAGVLLCIVEIVAAAASGASPLAPLRYASSIVLGSAGLSLTSLGGAAVLGLIVHFVLSAVYGAVYGALSARLPIDKQVDWKPQAALGALFGAALWLLNFQVFARLFYPWFLDVPQFSQFLQHAIFYGVPLSLMYASGERRARHLRTVPSH